jgi:hypothetical protein
MSSTTAQGIFSTGVDSAGTGVVITGVIDAGKLAAYLEGPTASVTRGIISGGTRFFKLAYIGGKPVVGIAAGAFSPGTGAAYDPKKDITRVVGTLELPSTIKDLGKDLFVGVQAAIKVEIPATVISAAVEKAKETTPTATDKTALTAIIGEAAKAAVTVTKGSDTAVITGDLALVKVGTPTVNASGLAVDFTFNKAVTVSSLSVSAGSSSAPSGSGTTRTITVPSITGSGAITIAFTATAGSESIQVNETVAYGTSGTPETNTVAVSTTANTTTTGLTAASIVKTADVHRITLTGTVAPTVPTALTSAYLDPKDFAVITFTGIKKPDVEVRIQQTSPGLANYVGNTANAGGPNFGTTAKTQAEIEAAYTADSALDYYRQTSAPVTYNRVKKYAADSDGDFSVIIAPAPSVGEQIATIVTKVITGTGADAVTTTTTFIIDYTAVIFDVSGTVKKSGESPSGSVYAHTTSGLSVSSAIRQGSDVYITLAGTNVPLTMDGTFTAAMFPGVTDTAVITLDGMWADAEVALLHQTNPGLEQYITTLGAGNGYFGPSTPKTLSEIETLFTANPGPYFWQTAAPVTYNKLNRSTGDGVYSILLRKTSPAADQQITITKKTGGSADPTPADYAKLITFHIDYTGVTFTP